MREFFRGWKRKAGCVTLVMALAGIGVFFRNLYCSDAITLRLTESADFSVYSMWDSFSIVFLRDRLSNLRQRPWIDSRRVDPDGRSVYYDPWAKGVSPGATVQFDFMVPGFRFVSATLLTGRDSDLRFTGLVVADVPCVMLLTLISACLLLSKTRPAKQRS